jgi:hypothetical protein
MTGLTSPSSLDIEKGKGVSFQMGRVLTIITAHFIHDTYSAFLAPLLPILIEKLSLTYTHFDSFRSLWVVFTTDHPRYRPGSASRPPVNRKWFIYDD